MRTKLLKTIFLLLIVLASLVVLLFVALSFFESPLYAWRIVTMGNSDTADIHRFGERFIEKGEMVSNLPYEPAAVPETVTWHYRGEMHSENLQELTQRTGTAAFVVIRDDKIILQIYNNSQYSTPNTSFSVAKSFNSALIGAAIADGYIGSVDDPMIQYIPELAGRGLDTLTIRNLLLMDSGIHYLTDDDILAPFSDDALTYYAPDLRKLALGVRAGELPIGEAFRYNNYHPLLEGIIIERATGMPVAQYLQERIWKPMGAEFPASWSLDSAASGFEKMESGINAAAVDFARFGLLFLHNGQYNGKQILPVEWVQESTAPLEPDPRSWADFPSWPETGGYYKYHWWGLKYTDGTYDFMARGHQGQIIYVSPRKNMVVVRFGPEPDPDVIWTYAIQALIDQMP
jgi:CubicO group peptidase (beta-lactamase class C family)